MPAMGGECQVDEQKAGRAADIKRLMVDGRTRGDASGT